MNLLERIHQHVRTQLRTVFDTVLVIVDGAFRTISLVISPEDAPVLFPEDQPFTVVTANGSVRLEPIAFAMFRYCWYVCHLEGRNEIPFAELGEKIYDDPCKPRATIQNAIKRGELVEALGIVYFYSGEYVFVKIS